MSSFFRKPTGIVPRDSNNELDRPRGPQPRPAPLGNPFHSPAPIDHHRGQEISQPLGNPFATQPSKTPAPRMAGNSDMPRVFCGRCGQEVAMQDMKQPDIPDQDLQDAGGGPSFIDDISMGITEGTCYCQDRGITYHVLVGPGKID